ncbi:MAG: ADP-heptose--LPS heptosyltransferase [Ignavibacteriales bacterium]
MEILKNRILVIQTAFLGDCLLTIPFLVRLREKNPDAEISVVTSAKTGQIFSALRCIDRVLILDKRGKHKTMLSTIGFAEEISKTPFTALFALHRSFRTSLFSFFVRAAEKTGFDNASFSFLYKKTIPYKADAHEVDRNLHFLNEAGFDLNLKCDEVFNFSDEHQTRVEETLNGFGSSKDNIIAVAPGSVWQTKRYPVEYYAEITDVLSRQGRVIALIGGREESPLAEEILSKSGGRNIFNLCGNFNILESILFLSRVRMLICNDSAPVHMGFLAGTPVLEIYCSTVPEFGFYPYGKNSGYISKELPCKPCGIHGHKSCPLGTFDCAHKVTPLLALNRIEKDFL